MDIFNVVAKIKTNLIGQIKSNESSARKKTLEKIVKDTDDYVPYKTGKLSSNVSIDEYTSTIEYKEPYASFAFNDVSPSGLPKEYNKSIHTKAGGYPLKRSFEDNEVKWAEYYAKELMKDVE